MLKNPNKTSNLLLQSAKLSTMDRKVDETELLSRQIEQLQALKDASSTRQVNSGKVLEKIMQCLEFLAIYDIKNVDENLLKYVVPATTETLKRVLKENCTILDTADDDFIVDIIKANIEIAIGLVQCLKTVMAFVVTSSQIQLKDIASIPENVGTSLTLIFDHCKVCQENCKDFYSDQLLNLFRVAQEVHHLFMVLFETCIILSVASSPEDQMVLTNVLVIICNMGEILSGMNAKTIAVTWKGFLGITQKFSDILRVSMDLKLPFQTLSKEIHRNLTLLQFTDPREKTVQGSMKITGFLFRVLLKLLENFFELFPKVYEEFIDFCGEILYSFHPDSFRNKGHSEHVVESIDATIFKSIDGFLLKLIKQDVDLFILPSMEDRRNYPLLLNAMLRIMLSIDHDFIPTERILMIFRGVCHSLRKVADFPQETFDELVVNSTAVVLVFNDQIAAEKLCQFLLQQVLQPHCLSALFAGEVLGLVIWNLPTSQDYSEIGVEIGCFTSWPQLVFYRLFLQRISSPLSTVAWMKIQNEVLPTLENKLDAVKDINRAILAGFLSLAKDFQTLSKITPPNSLVQPQRRLIDCLMYFWGFDPKILPMSNNLTRWFFLKQIQLTKLVFPNFTAQELRLILNQLAVLSMQAQYKLLVAECLTSFLLKTHPTPLGGYRSLIAKILYNLQMNTSEMIRENSVEIAQFVTGISQDSFQSNVATTLVTNEFRHKCLIWKRENGDNVEEPVAKKLKVETVALVQQDLNLVDDVLVRIKDEVKTLDKVLKSGDELTRKNIADINIVVRQLQNFIS